MAKLNNFSEISKFLCVKSKILESLSTHAMMRQE